MLLTGATFQHLCNEGCPFNTCMGLRVINIGPELPLFTSASILVFDFDAIGLVFCS